MRGAARPPRGFGGTPPVGEDAVTLYKQFLNHFLNPDTTARNRTRQQTRDPARRVRDLANNHLALDLQSCAALFGCSAPPRCILPTTTWLPPKFIVEGLIQQPRNLANHNVLASAPVLTENRISPPPC